MIISDLQYIENVDNSEVQGAGYYDYYKSYYTSAKADANADATAIGDYSNAFTNTASVADSDAGVSLSSSKSYAEASTKKYYHYY